MMRPHSWFKTIQSVIIAAFLTGNLTSAALPSLPSDHLQPYLRQLAVDEPDSPVRVIIQAGDSTEAVKKEAKRIGGKIVQDLSFIQAFSVEMPAGKLPILAQQPEIHWISLDAPVHSSSATDGSQTNARDDFNTPQFDGSNGGLTWSSAWQEEGEADGPLLGDVAVTDFFGGALTGLRIQGEDRGIHRFVNLTGATSATLTIAYRRKDFSEADQIMLQVSADGGASWTNLANLTGPATDAEIQYANYSVSDFMGESTGVRFVSSADFSSNAKFYLDSIDLHANIPAVDSATLTNKVYLPMMAGGDGSSAVSGQPVAFDKNSALSEESVTASATCTYECFDLTKLQSVYDKAIGADKIWNVSPYVRGWAINVAIVDSGITQVPDLNDYSGFSRIQTRAQFGGAAGTVDDYYGHGTHIAGTIGGIGTRSNGAYVGVAPESRFIDVKVINDYGYGSTSDVVAGLQWIYNNRSSYSIDIANLSLNSTVPESYLTSPLDAAVEILWFNKIVVVVSAGNKGSQHLYPPANDPFVITVGAVDDKGTAATTDDTLAPFSAFGITESGFRKPEILAPGKDIIQTLASDDSNLARDHAANKVTASTGYNYFKMSGTSMAAAVVSGAVALLLENELFITPDQVKYRLMATAQPISSSSACATGSGELDIYAALNGTTTQSANTNIRASQLLWSGSNPITWNSVNWNSVNWNSVNWNSVNWNSVNWNSVNWNNSVWDSASWDSTTTTSSSASCMGVTSFTLVNADSDKDVQPLFPGAVLDLRTIGTSNLTARANVAGTLASVNFDMDSGSYTKLDSAVPYALAGDSSGNYAGISFAMGNHTLKGTPYTLANGTGSAGNSMLVNFRVSTSLQAVHSSKCLNVPNSSLATSTALTQSDCNSGKNQLFEVNAVAGKVNRYNLINTNSNLCLDVNGGSTSDNAALIQYPCTGGLNQEFSLNPVSGATNVYTIVAAHSNKCLNVVSSSTANGAAVVQYSCNNGQNQQWRLVK